MYVGVDVGGTKTLLAVLNEHGEIVEQKKLPTPKTYANFLLELKHAVSQLETKDFKAGAVAIPGRIDRKHGRGIVLSNLSWKNFNIQHDAENIFKCPIAIENDTKLAGLSEAMLIKDKYSRIAYVTISTGIGYTLVVDSKLDVNVGDTGGRAIQLEHKGKMMAWEDFASGRAIVERYGKMAKDIDDPAVWHQISRELAQGFIHLIAILEPEVIVIGGSVGEYFDKYADFLSKEITRYKLPMVVTPDLRQAQRPEEAVIYGCYDYAKQVYGHAKSN